MSKMLAALCEPAFVGLVRLLHRGYAIRFQGEKGDWKSYIKKWGGIFVELSWEEITVRSSISTHFSPSSRHFQKRFSPVSCMRLFRSTTSTRSRKCGFVGYVRRHGFILPTIRDW